MNDTTIDKVTITQGKNETTTPLENAQITIAPSLELPKEPDILDENSSTSVPVHQAFVVDISSEDDESDIVQVINEQKPAAFGDSDDFIYRQEAQNSTSLLIERNGLEVIPELSTASPEESEQINTRNVDIEYNANNATNNISLDISELETVKDKNIDKETDTKPIANADSASITEDAASNKVSGNVIANDSGGDDAPFVVSAISFGGGQTVGTAFNSTYGTLLINADGTYSYTLDNTNISVQDLLASAGDTLVETFTYTLQDADGDNSTSTLTLTIHGDSDRAIERSTGTRIINTTTSDDEAVFINNLDTDNNNKNLEFWSNGGNEGNVDLDTGYQSS